MCESLRRLAALITPLAAILLTLSSARAETLTPVKLRVDGKEIALKISAVTDGREVYLPLEVLRLFGAQHVLSRREETAFVSLSSGQTVEIALARPGRQPMLPLSALTGPLKVESQLNKTTCEIITEEERRRRAGRGEGREQAAAASSTEQRAPAPRSPLPAPQRADAQRAETPDGGPMSPVDVGGKAEKPKERAGTPPDSKPAPPARKEEGKSAQSPLDAPLSTPLPEDVQKTDSLDVPMKGGGASSTPQTEVKPGALPIRITGVAVEIVNDAHARIRIRTSGRAVAQVTLISDPFRLAIDLPNTALETEKKEWEIRHPLLTALRAVEAERPGTTRFVVDLARLISYRVQPAADEGLTIHLGLPRGAGRRMQDLIVVVDPGHGGNSGLNPSGCRAWHNGVCIYEKHLTLAIATKLRRHLEAAGATVLMTRTTDVNVPLPQRAKLANDNNADLLLSIHIDSCKIPNSASGTTTYYHRQDPSSRALAQSIVERIARVSGLPNRRARSDTVLYTNGLAVLRHSAVPATLIEVGYLNHSRDRAKLVNAAFQETIAKAIFDGVRGYVEGALPDETLAPMEPEIE